MQMNYYIQVRLGALATFKKPMDTGQSCTYMLSPMHMWLAYKWTKVQFKSEIIQISTLG